MTQALLIATVEASAEAAKVSGGMSLVSPEIITALFVGLAGLVTAIATLVWGTRANNRKMEELRKEFKIANDPLNVEKVDKPVTRGECKQYRCAIQKQIEAIGPALGRVFNKLDENDKRSEERAKDTHRRLDPILVKVSENMARVDLLEKIVVGKKEKGNGESAA